MLNVSSNCYKIFRDKNFANNLGEKYFVNSSTLCHSKKESKPKRTRTTFFSLSKSKVLNTHQTEHENWAWPNQTKFLEGADDA